MPAQNLDRNGAIDIVVPNGWSGTVFVWKGLGNATFHAPRTYPVRRDPRFIVAEDLTGDGLLDLAVVYYDTEAVSVLLNKER